MAHLLNIEAYRRGEPMNNALDESRPGNDMIRFQRFIDSLDKWGFDYNHSYLPVAYSPFIGYQEGSHRAAYFIEKYGNAFVPIKIRSPGNAIWFSINGADYCKEVWDIENSKIEACVNRFRKLQSSLYKEFVGVIKFDKFNLHRSEIVSSCKEIGLFRGDGACKVHFLREFERWTKLKCHNEELFEKVRIRLDWNRLDLRRGRYISRRISDLSRRMNKICGSNWGYISNSVTESVYLEDLISSVSANEKLYG